LIPLLLAATVATAAPAPKTAPPAQASSQQCPDLVTPDALVCRALDAQSHGDNAAAAQSFEEAAKMSSDRDRKTARMYAAAGNLWIAADQPGKAAFDLDKALTLPGLEGEQRGEALLDRARAAEAQNDLPTARAKLAEAGQTISQDPFYWYFSASLALREHDAAAARNAIGQALKLAPEDPTILFEAGHVAEYSGDDGEARTYWQRAVSADPKGSIGTAAARAIEMLGVTPAVKGESRPPAKTHQPRS
jgi:tetratricopeptide (TPR) repeat protein